MPTTTTSGTNDDRKQHSVGSKIKGAFNVAHGIGDSIRGQFMGAIDDSPENREIANSGRLETERGMDAFHKKPISTNSHLDGYNNTVGNGPSTTTPTVGNAEPHALHHSENIPTQPGERLEPQRLDQPGQTLPTSNAPNTAGYPPPPPQTNNGNPVADQDELLAAKAEERRMTPQLGPEIPAMDHGAGTYPNQSHQFQSTPAEQPYQQGATQMPPNQAAMPSAPHHHRDDAIVNPTSTLNTDTQVGGSHVGGPQISTQDKLDGNVHPPTYHENPNFGMGNVRPGDFVPGSGVQDRHV